MANRFGTSEKILFLYLLRFLISSALACKQNNALTHERCRNTSDCAQDITHTECFGRINPYSDSTRCPNQSTNRSVDICRCVPFITHYCEDNRDCIDQEYCAFSRRSGNRLCVGCLTLTEPYNEGGFDPVQPFETKNFRCHNGGHSHPPCGYAEDFCSPSMPCDSDYTCISDVEGSFFECGWESIRCVCGKLSTAIANSFDRQPCEVDEQCKEREICALFSKHNSKFCVSCDFMKESHDVIPLNSSASSKCQAVHFERRPQPKSYVEGPNGRTMDRCLNNLQCTGGRKCVTEEYLINGTKALVRCANQRGALCYCRPSAFIKCKTGRDCDVGESCITLNPIRGEGNYGIDENCVANSFFDILSSKDYDVVGIRTRSPNDGPGLTNDQCKFDWDCALQRRCTHLSDVFGGCAGRANCKCKPLVNPSCTSQDDCIDGETCVTVVGASFDPYCMSSTAARSDPFIFSIGDPELAQDAEVTPIPAGTSAGLTGDNCLTSSQCVAPRKCYHRFDLPVVTDTTRCDNGNVRNCVCMLPLDQTGYNCTTTADCKDDGEICTILKDEVPNGRARRRCMSRLAYDSDTAMGIQYRIEYGINGVIIDKTTSSGSGGNGTDDSNTSSEDEAPCVDVKLLRHFKTEDLVYPQHLRASVLCDEHGSCATPGHMVTFQNKPMAMKSYCVKHATCSKRLAWVNNPRMKTGLRMESNTKDLQLTVLSARYESWGEETILRHIIHLGV